MTSEIVAIIARIEKTDLHLVKMTKDDISTIFARLDASANGEDPYSRFGVGAIFKCHTDAMIDNLGAQCIHNLMRAPKSRIPREEVILRAWMEYADDCDDCGIEPIGAPVGIQYMIDAYNATLAFAKDMMAGRA